MTTSSHDRVSLTRNSASKHGRSVRTPAQASGYGSPRRFQSVPSTRQSKATAGRERSGHRQSLGCGLQPVSRSRFLQASLFRGGHHPNPDPLKLNGQIDIVVINMVIGWTRGGEVSACSEICALSRPGTTVVAYQIGNVDPKPSLQYASAFLHAPETFCALWDEVGHATRDEVGDAGRAEELRRDGMGSEGLGISRGR